MRPASVSKYRNQHTLYRGRIYDSMREAHYAMELDARLAAHEITAWRPQVTFHLDVNGTKVCDYRADFVVTFPEGRTEVHEVKGYATPVWKVKKALFEALFPNLPLVVIR